VRAVASLEGRAVSVRLVERFGLVFRRAAHP
jgi:hypothetical protein